jgi:hypothetical protein
LAHIKIKLVKVSVKNVIGIDFVQV